MTCSLGAKHMDLNNSTRQPSRLERSSRHVDNLDNMVEHIDSLDNSVELEASLISLESVYIAQ